MFTYFNIFTKKKKHKKPKKKQSKWKADKYIKDTSTKRFFRMVDN
jgi:hypothetical protein